MKQVSHKNHPLGIFSISIIIKILVIILGINTKGAILMKKVFFYLGNLAQAVIALFLYGILQNFYFFPAIIHQKYHLSEQGQVLVTALLTVFVLWLIFWMYKKQLKEVNYWGLIKSRIGS